MNVHKLAIEVRSPLGTPLAADTLWGHVAWGIRWNEGDAFADQWLADHDAVDRAPLLLSDPLPEGFWPRPAVPPPPRGDAPPSVAAANGRKRAAEVGWLPEAAWNLLAPRLSSEATARECAALATGGGQGVAVPLSAGGVVVHAGVNRLTGGTAQAEGGSLFAVERTFFARPARFTVWARSRESTDVVRRWLEWGVAGGYGRDAAAGAGEVAVVDAQLAALPTVAAANAAVALSAFTPQPSDPARGFFRPLVRCGRVGGNFAIGPLPDGSLQRQKKPLAMFGPGTLLFAPDGPPPLAGQIVAGVHAYRPIRHHAAALLLPCRLDDQLAHHPLLDPQAVA